MGGPDPQQAWLALIQFNSMLDFKVGYSKRLFHLLALIALLIIDMSQAVSANTQITSNTINQNERQLAKCKEPGTGVTLLEMGEECFYIHNIYADWYKAKETCEMEGMALPEPQDVLGLRQYFSDYNNYYHHWLGGQGNDKAMIWASSGVEVYPGPSNSPVWESRHPTRVPKSDCLDLRPTARPGPLAPYGCSNRHRFICGNRQTNPIPGNCTLMGKVYATGTEFHKNCMKFFCKNSKWYSSNQYNALCAECSFNNDPHFSTFDDIRFDWHGHSAYVISQEGGDLCPNSSVSSLFTDCVYGLEWATCVNTVYFQPEPNTKIEIVKASILSNSQIMIDGFTQNLNGNINGELTILKGQNGVEHPAFGWMRNGCIYIMGFKEEGYLVRISSWGASVFAFPSMKNNLCGLCGNWDGDKSNDIRFRDGFIIDPPPQEPRTSWIDLLIEPIYGLDWEVRNCDGNGRIIESMKKLTTPAHIVNPCNATTDEIKVFIQRCKDMDSDHHNKFIDECAFDQCIATRSGDKSLPDKWLSESKKLVEEVEQQKNDTIVYPEDCVSPWVLIGNSTGCFLFVKQKMNWDSARTYCQKEGGDLATLDEKSKRIDMVKYFEESGLTDTSNLFWLGANDRSGSWLWLNGKTVTDGWRVGQPSNDKGDDTCMYIYPNKYDTGHNFLLDYFCTYSRIYLICEK